MTTVPTKLADVSSRRFWGTIDQVGPLVAVSLVERGGGRAIGPVYCDTPEEADAAARAWITKHGGQ